MGDPERYPVTVVLTGGPSAGKSEAAVEVARRFGGAALHVPEAATQVYERSGVLWTDLTVDQRREKQTEMYRLQLEQEAALRQRAARGRVPLLILDRGTLDGAGYWPDGVEGFFPAHETTHAAELARYDAVLLLETVAVLPGKYEQKANNRKRFESPEQAVSAGEIQRRLWGTHPRFTVVRATETFAEKLDAVEREVRRIAHGLGAALPRG